MCSRGLCGPQIEHMSATWQGSYTRTGIPSLSFTNRPICSHLRACTGGGDGCVKVVQVSTWGICVWKGCTPYLGMGVEGGRSASPLTWLSKHVFVFQTSAGNFSLTAHQFLMVTKVQGAVVPSSLSPSRAFFLFFWHQLPARFQWPGFSWTYLDCVLLLCAWKRHLRSFDHVTAVWKQTAWNIYKCRKPVRIKPAPQPSACYLYIKMQAQHKSNVLIFPLPFSTLL